MPALFSVGHSTLSLQEFVGRLRGHAITQIADVRRHPVSRRQPHFSRPALAPALAAKGIAYRWFADLGGMRQPHGQARHAAWTDPALQGYADHMESPEFAAACGALQEWARTGPTAVLCAERDPLQCHRQLLSDAFVASGWEVWHIVSADAPRRHVPPPFAVFELPGRVHYPAAIQASLFGKP